MESGHGQPECEGPKPMGAQEGPSLHLQSSMSNRSDLLLMDALDLGASNSCFDEAVFYEDPPPRVRLEHPYSSLPSLPQAQGLEQSVTRGSTWHQLSSPTSLNCSMRLPELGSRINTAHPLSSPSVLLRSSLNRFPEAESSLVDAKAPSGRCLGKVMTAATSSGSPVCSNPGDAPRSYLRVAEEVETRVEGARRRLSGALSKFVAGEESGRSSRKLSISLTELAKIMSGRDSDDEENEVEVAAEVMGSDGCAARKRATEDTAKSDSLDCIFNASTGRREARQDLQLEFQDLPGGQPLLKESLTFAHERDPQYGPSTPPPRHQHQQHLPHGVDTEARPSDVQQEDLVISSPGTKRGDRVPLEALCFLSLLAYTWLVFPLPPLLSGLLFGAAWGFAAAIVSMWLQAGHPRAPGRVSTPLERGLRGRVSVLTLAGPPVYEGWLNEVDSYDPEVFHSSALRRLYVNLNGATLSLSRTAPGTKNPEPHGFDGSNSRTRRFDIAGCTVSLAPARLAEKRTWSKKYPIVLTLTGGASTSVEGMWSSVGQVAGTEEGAVLFLFGRTGREKEEWFQRFLHASSYKVNGDHAETHGDCWSNDQGKDAAGLRAPLNYERYIKSFIPANGELGGEVACINALIGRILWDALTSEQWAQLISAKIQQKLGKIRLPPFLDALELTELDMGIDVLRVQRAFPPTLDAQGLWVDLDVSYSGSFEMTLETKLNLSKIGKEETESGRAAQDFNCRRRSRVKIIADSEDESSAESSLDSDDGDGMEAVSGGQAESTDVAVPGCAVRRGSRGLLGLLGRLARSDCLRRAAENPLVRRTVAGVSNTPLALTVAVHQCWGKLALNIPPPPSDRIWYGFREPPRLGLKVHPKLGERHVTLTHVTDWIEKKLEVEFENNFVIPNMDDLQIPIMHAATDGLHSHESSSLPPPLGTPSGFP